MADVTSTRRGVLGAIAGVPLAATFGTIPLPAMASHGLFAEIDAHNRETDRLNHHPADDGAPDEEWDRWSEVSNDLFGRIEALPATAENMRIKARAVHSIVDHRAAPGEIDLGELSAYADGRTGRLIRQILAYHIAH